MRLAIDIYCAALSVANSALSALSPSRPGSCVTVIGVTSLGGMLQPIKWSLSFPPVARLALLALSLFVRLTRLAIDVYDGALINFVTSLFVVNTALSMISMFSASTTACCITLIIKPPLRGVLPPAIQGAITSGLDKGSQQYRLGR
mmetsp:Transcript_71323/g.118536  ORF Transcript_71323/g.118536 Transcript_71323/m.118536 type:complete len:146 (-) Transcript_71323:173-610(-)